MTTELTHLTLAEAASLIARRKISPVELTRACLAHIEALDPLVNSFITVMAEMALQQARAAEEAIQRGDYQGALFGIPVALKDLIETAGVRTTAGSRHLASYVPTEDAALVQRLKQAGAILLGKLN
ncbi:MAG: amidase family protein, partial [Ardenticatenaceae bacterium]